MKWIVIVENGPAHLHALLWSAHTFLPNAVPDVIIPASSGREDSHMEAYQLLASRALKKKKTIHWHQPFESLHNTVLEIADRTRNDGRIEPFTLITTDEYLFRDRVVVTDAMAALQDENMLGLSLTLAAKMAGPPLTPIKWKDQEPSIYTWLLKGQEPHWSATFSLGTIYRTADLLGPLYRNPWNTVQEMERVLGEDRTLWRRTRMACRPDVSLVPAPREKYGEAGVYHYLSGNVLELDDDQSNFHWTPYQEEKSDGQL